jgi:hypothetical protein
MKEENNDLTATEKAISMLSDDNRRWMESWVKEGWEIRVTDDFQEWLGAKVFDGEEKVTGLEGHQSLISLLKEIETVEHQRRQADQVAAEKQAEIDASSCLACGEPGVPDLRFCDRCKSPGFYFTVPTENDFVDGRSDYLAAPEIAGIAHRLIEHYIEDFWAIRHAKIDYLWKKKGGENLGRAKLGYLKKSGGELNYYSQKDYLCVLSADNCIGMNGYQITALVFHELKHGGKDPEKGKFIVNGHDFEGFRREVELFGWWKSDIAAMREAFVQAEQLELFQEDAARVAAR